MYAYDHANIFIPLSLIMLKAVSFPPKRTFYIKLFFSFLCCWCRNIFLCGTISIYPRDEGKGMSGPSFRTSIIIVLF
jgi:hypothetical protein